MEGNTGHMNKDIRVRIKDHSEVWLGELGLTDLVNPGFTNWSHEMPGPLFADDISLENKIRPPKLHPMHRINMGYLQRTLFCAF